MSSCRMKATYNVEEIKVQTYALKTVRQRTQRRDKITFAMLFALHFDGDENSTKHLPEWPYFNCLTIS